MNDGGLINNLEIMVWIDREHASLVSLRDNDISVASFRQSEPDHHTHRVQDTERKEPRKLFQRAVELLKNASRILIVGPGVTKFHFRTYLVEHHPAQARKVVGCETLDHPSEGQLKDYAKKHFRA